MEEFIKQSILDYGILAGLVIFFVWQGSKILDKTNNRLTEVENYVKHELSSIVSDVSGVVQKNTEVMERLERFLERNEDSRSGKS